MTKFKPVLTDDELTEITRIAYVCDYENWLARKVEQAVLAKLAEQEPVAWRIHPFDYGVGVEGAYAITQQEDMRQAWINKGWAVTPLYANPIPSSQGILDNSIRQHGQPLYTNPCVALVSDKPACDSQNEKYETQIPDGTLINEGTKGQHRPTENHTPDAGKMIEHESHSLEFEVRTMVEMLEAKEWAEHCGTSDLGQRLEWAITSLHNEAQIIRKIIPDGWQLVPKEPTREVIRRLYKINKHLSYEGAVKLYQEVIAPN